MADLSFEIGVVCEKCGKDLSASFDERKGALIVEPCEKCMSESDEEGYSRGYDEGYDVGKEES